VSSWLSLKLRDLGTKIKQKWDTKMSWKMVIFAKAMTWFDFPKMIIFHVILFSFLRSFFENEIENELENEPKMTGKWLP
jgi:hypothetical protein